MLPVAHNSIDCGPSAPLQLNLPSEDIVSLQPDFWDAGPGVTVTPLSVGNEVLGNIINDPQLSTLYMNANVTTATGSVTAQTTVLFIAGNGTVEGAQQKIMSPLPSSSRIAFVDVLVCTSTTTIEMDTCIINQGAVTGCAFTPKDNSLGVPLNNGGYTAIFLAASPVTAYYHLPSNLPMYNSITEEMLLQQTLPTSDLTFELDNPHYGIPLNYVRDVIFGQTGQMLVQGLTNDFAISQLQQLSLIAIFPTSKSWLAYLLFGVCVLCALVSTLAGAVRSAARHAATLDVPRLLAISRNKDLDNEFIQYSDRNLEMELEGDLKVGYGFVETEGIKALYIGARSKRGYKEA